MTDKQKIINAIKHLNAIQDAIIEQRKVMESLDEEHTKAANTLIRQLGNYTNGHPVLFNGWEYSINNNGALCSMKSSLMILEDPQWQTNKHSPKH